MDTKIRHAQIYHVEMQQWRYIYIYIMADTAICIWMCFVVNVIAASSRCSFYLYGLTWIPTCKSDHIQNYVWDEITYSFPNFLQLHRWSFGMDKWFHPTFTWTCDNISTLGIDLILVIGRGRKSSGTKSKNSKGTPAKVLCQRDP